MKIGILGGGQLGRMLALAGTPLGLDFSFYEANKTNCVSNLGPVLHADFNDHAQLQKFAASVDVVTYENENIPLSTLETIAANKAIYPHKNAVSIMQDRLLEKNTFTQLQIPTTRFFEINNKNDVDSAAKELGYPFVLKKRRFGYDGKGQTVIKQMSDLNNLTADQCANSIAEEFIKFDREVSLIAARNTRGEVAFYDVNENIHQEGILFRTQNKINDAIFNLAKSYLEIILTHLNYIGILTVEFFQVADRLIANEMAPRVHNSGHWTIEGTVSSQFENHLRCILGWPLGDTSSIGAATMYNILGKMPDKNALLKILGLHLHDYQKAEVPKRKIGHVTLFPSSEAACKKIEALLL